MFFFNNETRLWEYDQEAFDSQWLENTDGHLYIIGGPDSDIFGPDDDVITAINLMLQASGEDHLTEEQYDSLALVEIPDILKRFTPEDGPYHA